MNELRGFLNLALVILLPMAPAYVLFKALPGTAAVSGPLQGLNIKLGGAFAGYFALLVLVFSTHNIWNPAPSGQVWEVSGTVADEDGAVLQPLDPKDIGVIPRSFNAYADGTFTLTVPTTPTQGGGTAFPRVMVGHPNFQTTTIPLDPSDAAAAHVGLVRDETNHQIRIPTIHLKRLPEYFAGAHAEKEMIATKGTQP
ncbi:MAG: hypothetical protein LAO20_19870 [Acidobacteriia bacterium]|nr:hypothetical protein [Terriglobia bacterium]